MSIEKINRPFYPPKLAPGTGSGSKFPFSRGNFLDGTIKTYYGPGQPPDAGSTLVGYTTPTNWPAAGTPLYVPQVVWLSTFMHDLAYRDPTRLFTFGFVVTPYLIYRRPTPKGGWNADWQYQIDVDDGISSVPIIGLSDQLGNYSVSYYISGNNGVEIRENTIPAGTIPSDNYEEPGAYISRLDNPYPDEYLRLLEVFNETKQLIENLRPNRTWVEVIEWLQPEVLDLPANYFLPLQDPDNEDDYYIHLVAPQDRDKYFGVNFLHIFAGDPTTVTGRIESNTFSINPLADDTFNQSYIDVKYVIDSGSLQSERFANYAIRAFALPSKEDDGPGPLPPLHQNPPPEFYVLSPKPIKTIEGVYYTHDPDFPDDFLGLHQIRHTYTIDPWYPTGMIAGKVPSPPAPLLSDPPPTYYALPGLSTYMANGQSSLDSSYVIHKNRVLINNNGVLNSIATRRNILIAQMEFLKDHNVDAEYSGTTGEITVSFLVDFIADHFKFDSETGKDL